MVDWRERIKNSPLRLPADEKTLHLVKGQGRREAPSFTIISEAGLYRLVMRSDKPVARKMQDWVARDVLPAIRKDGAYVRGEEMLKSGVVETLDLNDLDALRDRIEILLQRKSELLEQRLAAAEAKIAAQAPAVAVFDAHYAKAERQSVASFARTLDGVNSHNTKRDLMLAGYLWKTVGGADGASP